MTDSSIPSATLTLADPAKDSDALAFGDFANTMSTLTGTVCVVTAGTGDHRLGRTVTAILSLTANPPSLLVSITRGSELDTAIRAEGGFSLAMLAPDQTAISDAFAGQRPPETRFALGTWTQWPSGRPKLLGAATAIDCRLSGVIELDTHCLFAGVLIGAQTDRRAPLLWRDRGYRTP